MSIVAVQCKGSGQRAVSAGSNTRRAQCPHCQHERDVRPDGKFRKHTKLARKKDLR